MTEAKLRLVEQSDWQQRNQEQFNQVLEAVEKEDEQGLPASNKTTARPSSIDIEMTRVFEDSNRASPAPFERDDTQQPEVPL